MNNNRVQVFRMDGSFVRKWGSQGKKDGELHDPIGITYSNGMVYVADDYRIQVFDSIGRFITKWGSGSRGAGDGVRGQLSEIVHGLMVDEDGRVYVSEYENNRIEVFG